MLKLLPAESSEPGLVRAVGCLALIPITIILVIALTAIMVWIASVLQIQPLACGAFFVLALAAAGLAINRAMRRFLSARWRNAALRKLREPIVSLSTDKVHVGDSFTVIYHQEIQQPVDITRLTIRLIQRTHTMHRRDVYGVHDTKTHQRDRIVQVEQRNGQRYKAEATFHREVSFTIPAGERPTSETAQKREEWLIVVHLAVSHRIPYQEEYAFRVLAEPNKSRP